MGERVAGLFELGLAETEIADEEVCLAVFWIDREATAQGDIGARACC